METLTTDNHVTSCAAKVDHGILKYYDFMCKKNVQYCKKNFFRFNKNNVIALLRRSVYLLRTSFLNGR